MSTKKRRSFFAMLAVPAGVTLLVLEIARPRESPVEHWFWLIVGGLLILLGAAEYLAKRSTPGESDSINPRLDER